MKKHISFILTILVLLAGCTPSTSDNQQIENTDSTTFRYADTIPWDATYDVVVVGFGGSGAITAITASDEGSKVLIVEKAPEGKEGGNTKVSGQHVVDFTDLDEGMEYLKAMRGNFTNWPDEYIEKFINGVGEFEEWWNSFGYTEYEVRPRADFQELPGKDSVIMYYTENPGKPRLWDGLHEQVIKRSDNIDIWYNSPGKELIQDPYNKNILGVKVEVNGTPVNVHAKNGVVLATGGFENNDEMIQDYLQRPYSGPLGSLYNTGDGIKMAQAVGAELWHMNATSGPFAAFQNPETGNAIRFPTSYIGDHGAIFIGPDGTRFMDETFEPKHGYKNYHGQYMTVAFPLPCYMLMDSETISEPVLPIFSEGNEEEIEKGWIIKGNTLEELAKAIDVPAGNLKSEVGKYNGYCAAGEDPFLGRPTEKLKPLDNGPYYAIKVTPSNLNTQGGPKRNLECEVLDTFGNPIPNLYSVGELGSMHPTLYQGGSNLGECFVTGRTAGVNASKTKDVPDETVLQVATQPDSFVYDNDDDNGEIETGDDEYIGTGTGMNGNIVVKVKMDGDKIAEITIENHDETPGISDSALEKMPDAIVAANSIDVDGISGATFTSNGIKEAAEDALSKIK